MRLIRETDIDDLSEASTLSGSSVREEDEEAQEMDTIERGRYSNDIGASKQQNNSGFICTCINRTDMNCQMDMDQMVLPSATMLSDRLGDSEVEMNNSFFYSDGDDINMSSLHSRQDTIDIELSSEEIKYSLDTVGHRGNSDSGIPPSPESNYTVSSMEGHRLRGHAGLTNTSRVNDFVMVQNTVPDIQHRYPNAISIQNVQQHTVGGNDRNSLLTPQQVVRVMRNKDKSLSRKRKREAMKNGGTGKISENEIFLVGTRRRLNFARSPGKNEIETEKCTANEENLSLPIQKRLLVNRRESHSIRVTKLLRSVEDRSYLIRAQDPESFKWLEDVKNRIIEHMKSIEKDTIKLDMIARAEAGESHQISSKQYSNGRFFESRAEIELPSKQPDSYERRERSCHHDIFAQELEGASCCHIDQFQNVAERAYAMIEERLEALSNAES